jgi:hypothetical protein
MTKRLMTETDLANLPDDSYRHELVAGVIRRRAASDRHSHDRALWRIGQRLRDHVKAGGLGEIFGEAGYLLARNPDTVRGPDLSFVSRERLAGFNDKKFFPGRPISLSRFSLVESAWRDAREGRRLPCRWGAPGLGFRS